MKDIIDQLISLVGGPVGGPRLVRLTEYCRNMAEITFAVHGFSHEDYLKYAHELAVKFADDSANCVEDAVNLTEPEWLELQSRLILKTRDRAEEYIKDACPSA